MSKEVNVLCLIPARMGSSRFPGKPLAQIAGKPMIEHVYQRAKASNLLTALAVATCDIEIRDYVESIGGHAIMTSNMHERASERCAEALSIFEKDSGMVFEVVVMVQGDEPLFNPEMISQVVEPLLKDESVSISNLMSPISDVESLNNRNFVKVVCDLRGNALYFSREPIPSQTFTQHLNMNRQLGIIAFRRKALLEYINLSESPLEILESVDMMRFLEHGQKIRMVTTNLGSQSVDTPEDLKIVEGLMALATTNLR
jgi:3-deoxy-manno-octulosonate cytidylyltransferase (CMP-KDO synthetase)